MGELILVEPLFPRTDHIDQLKKIFDVISTPDLATLDKMQNVMHKLPSRQKQDYKKVFGYTYETGSLKLVSGVLPQSVVLLDQLLSFDHRPGLTAEETLAASIF